MSQRRSSVHRVAQTLLACSLAALLVSGCGDEPTPPPENTGRLTVVISGLPDGVMPAVQVMGPGNYVEPVHQTTTFAQLAAGVYTITASMVTSAGTTYDPVPRSQTANVATGATATASVAYGASPP